MSRPDVPLSQRSPLRYFFREEHQYAPFVACAFFFATCVGFPLGLLLAHAAAEESTLGGRWPQLVQVHGHTQLLGWFGLFIMGMGYRLVSRFTALKPHRPWLVALSLLLTVSGLALRGVGQTFADEGTVLAFLFGVSGALEYLGISIFVALIIRALILGRPDELGYKWFFGAGAAWFAIGMLLNAYLVFVSAMEPDPVMPPDRSGVVAFLLLYGFASIFVLAVSVRTFPIFFGRQRANRKLIGGAWLALNAGIAMYAGSDLWNTYDRSEIVRILQNAGFVLVGVGLIGAVAALGIFHGTPHRLRESARRNMRFIRSAYAWLALAAALHVYFGVRALAGDRAIHAFETDAARHFIAIGFITTVIVGMSFLVMPALAMRRLGGRSARVVAVALLALLHGAAASRGLGSLIADEGHFDEGYWTMTIGGTLALLAMIIFVAYVLWNPRPPAGDDVALTERVA